MRLSLAKKYPTTSTKSERALTNLILRQAVTQLRPLGLDTACLVGRHVGLPRTTLQVIE